MSDLVRLRYTGEQAVTFQYPGVGHVEPNGEFDVPADDAERFTRRADVELAATGGKAKASPKEEALPGAKG